MTPTRVLPARALACVAALALSLGGAVGAFVITAGPAGAASFGPVDHTIPDGNTGSLREILENQISDGDTVVLEAGATYLLDNCEGGEISVDGVVTIQGNGATIEQT
ncbi:MAG: hypothetical protein ACXV2G_08175, partial [Actinomycetes bacterium]